MKYAAMIVGGVIVFWLSVVGVLTYSAPENHCTTRPTFGPVGTNPVWVERAR
jgi:hypothetical protein